jgi:hypothetical protein
MENLKIAPPEANTKFEEEPKNRQRLSRIAGVPVRSKFGEAGGGKVRGQKFSSSIRSFTYTLLVNARRFPSGEGTMEEIRPAPAGISYKTLGLPFAPTEKAQARSPSVRSGDSVTALHAKAKESPSFRFYAPARQGVPQRRFGLRLRTLQGQWQSSGSGRPNVALMKSSRSVCTGFDEAFHSDVFRPECSMQCSNVLCQVRAVALHVLRCGALQSEQEQLGHVLR